MKRNKYNMTITLAPEIYEILEGLYTRGLIKSRNSIIETALFEWFIRNGLFREKKNGLSGERKNGIK